MHPQRRRQTSMPRPHNPNGVDGTHWVMPIPPPRPPPHRHGMPSRAGRQFLAQARCRKIGLGHLPPLPPRPSAPRPLSPAMIQTGAGARRRPAHRHGPAHPRARLPAHRHGTTRRRLRPPGIPARPQHRQSSRPIGRALRHLHSPPGPTKSGVNLSITMSSIGHAAGWVCRRHRPALASRPLRKPTLPVPPVREHRRAKHQLLHARHHPRPNLYPQRKRLHRARGWPALPPPPVWKRIG